MSSSPHFLFPVFLFACSRWCTTFVGPLRALRLKMNREHESLHRTFCAFYLPILSWVRCSKARGKDELLNVCESVREKNI